MVVYAACDIDSTESLCVHRCVDFFSATTGHTV